MRKDVIKFLSKLPESPSDQYNQALSFYMRSENANSSIVRFHNTQGYSDQRLKELLYDLKQTFDIKDADLGPKPKSKVVKMTPPGVVENMPVFAKGSAGNKERKAYVVEHGLTAASNKNKDLDIAIIAHVKKLNAAAAEENLKQEVIQAMKTENEKDQGIGSEFVKSQLDKLGMTTEEFSAFIKENETLIFTPEQLKAAPNPDINEAFNKVVDVVRTEKVIPVSLVREIYNDAEMSEDSANAIIVEAAAVVGNEAPEDLPGNSTDVSDIETVVEESDTDVSKKETPQDVPEPGTPAPETGDKAEGANESAESAENPAAEKK